MCNACAWNRIKLNEAVSLIADILPDYKAEIRRTSTKRNQTPNFAELPILARAEGFLKEFKATREPLPTSLNELSHTAHELAERWDQIRQLIGAKSDDTVQEVYDRCEQYRQFWESHGGPA